MAAVGIFFCFFFVFLFFCKILIKKIRHLDKDKLSVQVGINSYKPDWLEWI